jgi:acetoin utilization deacetylase AcuC-like enzyme
LKLSLPQAYSRNQTPLKIELMSTLIFTHQTAVLHETPQGHPERGDRMKAIMKVLASPHFKGVPILEAPMGRTADILRAHSEDHYHAIAGSAPDQGFHYVDGDTVMSKHSLEAALRAVGAATSAVDAVFKGDAANAFCAMRPPGHHAERNRAMGFCLFNQAAIAALYARDKFDAERVAIVDFDVHHGNGTQDIVWSDADMFYGSTHQMPLFPGSGASSETGVGNIFNAPLRAGDGSQEFREAMNSVILPALDVFAPDLVIISAGFDAHESDPLGSLRLTEADFAWATLKLMEAAEVHCESRVVSVLEGGYDLGGLAASVAVHLQALMHGSDFAGELDEVNQDEDDEA